MQGHRKTTIIKNFRLKTLMWLIMKISILKSIHQCLESLDVLRQHNPFAAAYRYMYEVELEKNCLRKEHGKQPPNVRMYLLEGSRDLTR